jgi:hypothetical protein
VSKAALILDCIVLREIHFQIFSGIQLLLERFRKALVNAETATEREPKASCDVPPKLHPLPSILQKSRANLRDSYAGTFAPAAHPCGGVIFPSLRHKMNDQISSHARSTTTRLRGSDDGALAKRRSAQATAASYARTDTRPDVFSVASQPWPQKPSYLSRIFATAPRIASKTVRGSSLPFGRPLRLARCRPG